MAIDVHTLLCLYKMTQSLWSEGVGVHVWSGGCGCTCVVGVHVWSGGPDVAFQLDILS